MCKAWIQAAVLAVVGLAGASVRASELCGGVDYVLQESLLVDTAGDSNAFVRCVATGDLDNDGSPDIVASDRFSEELLLVLNDGSGGFLPPVSIFTTGAKWNRIILCEDLNGDGWVDIASSALGGLVVFLNRGVGASEDWLGFEPSDLYPSGVNPHWVDAADIDGDGDKDLLVADLGEPGEMTGFHYFLNDGTGDYAPGVQFDIGIDARCISIIGEDLNDDGLAEVLVTGRLPNAINVLHVVDNAGMDDQGNWAGLSYRSNAIIEYGACSIRSGDFDVDGDPDLVICHRTRGKITLLYNDGVGGLTHVEHPVPLTAEHAEPFDANRDGLPDLAVVIKEMNQVKIYVNDGSGLFASEESLATGVEPKFCAVADFDLDGSPDIVSADSHPGFDWSSLTIHRNRTGTVESTCDGDISCDGRIGVDDLLGVISGWGQTDHPGDVNVDGYVGVDDLLTIVSLWGPCDP